MWGKIRSGSEEVLQPLCVITDEAMLQTPGRGAVHSLSQPGMSQTALGTKMSQLKDVQ